MDIGFANAVLTERRAGKENQVEGSASSVAYQKLLAETLNMNRRILTFKSKPPDPIEPIPRALLSSPDHNAKSRTRRHISQVQLHKFQSYDWLGDVSVRITTCVFVIYRNDVLVLLN